MYATLIPEEMINQDIQDSKAYKIYLAFATGQATPKKARKFKKIASPSKKLDTPGVSVSKKKAPAKVDRGNGMDLLSDVTLLEAAQLKKVLKKSKLDTHMLHANGSDDGVDSSESKDESCGESRDDSDNDDDDDDDDDDDSDADGDNEASDSERTDSDEDENPNLNQNDDEEEEHEEEYVRTPHNYEFIDDDEKYEELYKVVNMRLKDVEHEEEGKGNAKMTDAGHGDGSQEKSYEQVKDEAHVTLTNAHVKQKTEVNKEVVSMMNVKVSHEEPSTQTTSFLKIPVTVIPKTLTAAAPTIPLTIPPITPLLQHSTPTPTTAPTNETTTTSIPVLLDFSSLLMTSNNVTFIASFIPLIMEQYFSEHSSGRKPDMTYPPVRYDVSDLLNRYNIEIFIKEFRTTNELLLKERSNLLSELKIEVNELSKIMGKVLIPENEFKGVTTRRGKMTSEATPSKEINEIGINKNGPPKFEQDFNDDELWYADFINYIVGKVVPPNWTFEKRKRFFLQVKTYFWEEPYAFKMCADNIIRRCVAGSEILGILGLCHSGPTGGHHGAKVTARKETYLQGTKCLKITFRVIKHILERSVGYNPKDWSKKLNDALWVFRTAYKTLIGCTPFRLVYGKACHLPIEIEHKAHWALKHCNMNLTLGSKSRLMQLNELAELRDGAYENTRMYKEPTKKWHDFRLRGDKDFKVGDKVLLYISLLKMYLGKLKSKWRGPNIVKTVYPYGAVEIIDRNGFRFKVNRQRLKKYYEGNINKEDHEVIKFENGIT
ncbi:reverse transcriptase domain-containing protein [Tanacetum coccineum]